MYRPSLCFSTNLIRSATSPPDLPALLLTENDLAAIQNTDDLIARGPVAVDFQKLCVIVRADVQTDKGTDLVERDSKNDAR